jgi:hypothetical protein
VTRATAGAATTLGGAVDGQVIWSGARFAVGPGTSLRVEPLQPIQPGR